VEHGHLGGRPPAVDLEAERMLAEILVAGSRDGMLSAAHDLSDGGLAQAVVESCLRGGRGARVVLPEHLDPFVAMFSESAGRAVVAVPRSEELRFTEMCDARGFACARVGVVDGDVLEVQGQFTVSLDEDPDQERELARAFSTRRTDGLLLAPAGDDQSYLASELRAGAAIVCLDRAASGLPVDSVVSTNVTGATEGVRHLIAGGHRRIGFLSDLMVIATARQRYDGYRDALRGAGLPIETSLMAHGLRDVAAADAAATALLARPDPPTALFTAQNLVTIGALRALRRLGLERSVALVGFDDFPLADLLSPGVTVVAQDPTTIGRTAATLLFRRIAGDAGPPTTYLVPTTLIARGSGEIPPPSPA
jgi:DNA-binding LacI/PurR family transcriptional regulator